MMIFFFFFTAMLLFFSFIKIIGLLLQQGHQFSHKNSASLLTELIPSGAITVLVWWSRWGWSNGENCTVMLMHAALNPMVLSQGRIKVILKVDWKYCKDRNHILNQISLMYTVKSVNADMQVYVLLLVFLHVYCCPQLLNFEKLVKMAWWSFCMSACLQVRFAHLHNRKGEFKWRICQMSWHLNASYSILRVAALGSNDCFTHINSSFGLWFLRLSTPFELSWFAQIRNQKVNFSTNVRLSVALPLRCIISAGVSLWNSSAC